MLDIEIIDNFLPDPEPIRKYAQGLIYQNHEHMGTTVAPAPIWQTYQLKFGLDPRLSFFRMGNGEPTSTYLHSDKSVGIKTSILYLNKPEDYPDGLETDGTVFWRHKETGLAKPADGQFCDFTKDQWKDMDEWEITRAVEMKFNRLIYYDSRFFHSRMSVDHWAGRLVQVVFF